MPQEVNNRLANIEAQIRGLRSELNTSLGPRAIEKRHKAIEQTLTNLNETLKSLDTEAAGVRESLNVLEMKFPAIQTAITKISEHSKKLKENLQIVRELPTLLAEQATRDKRLVDELRDLSAKDTADSDGELTSGLIRLLVGHFESGSTGHDIEGDGRASSAATKHRHAGS